MSKLQRPDLYKAVLNAAIELTKKGKTPSRVLHMNSYLHRASERGHCKLRDGFITPESAINVVIVRDFGKDNNRFSGHSPLPNYNNGGCYFFTNQASGLAEMMYYAEVEGCNPDPTHLERVVPWSIKTRRVSIDHLMPRKCIFKVKLLKQFIVADISLYGANAAHARAFLREVGGTKIGESGEGPSIEEHFKVRLDEHVINQDGDYSVTRALGHAFSKYFSGVIAQTARHTEREGESGENVCLFGYRDLQQIEGVYVVGAHLFD